MNVGQKSPWVAMLFTALAGGMGWGIRGQYGHETGAMLAGLLVALVLVYLFGYHLSSLSAARAVALATVAIGFGGSMTYGQTLGLTQDAPLIGNMAALRWGLLGTFIKGSIWIGYFGLFLGLGLGGKKYTMVEMALALIVAIFLFYLGIYVLNEPFDPASKKLPSIYFSDHWHWEPGETLKPRREQWGGLLFALGWLIAYTGFIKKDLLARNMVLWGMLAGGLGFSLGQSVQAYHAWNVDWFQMGWLASIEPNINWWNMMEITFGAVFGCVLALGLWCNRHHIATNRFDEPIELGFKTELGLMAIHIFALVTWNFMSFSTFDWFADRALTMGLIPLLAILGGRIWPYFVCLPITALPIAGKTLRQLAYRTDDISLLFGWFIYFMVPLALVTWFAIKLIQRPDKKLNGHFFSRRTLIISTIFYFVLNWAFFEFPWPWSDWTARTPSGIIFIICAAGLLLLTFYFDPRKGGWQFNSS
jgi:hypothetical protein